MGHILFCLKPSKSLDKNILETQISADWRMSKPPNFSPLHLKQNLIFPLKSTYNCRTKHKKNKKIKMIEYITTRKRTKKGRSSDMFSYEANWDFFRIRIIC